MYIKSISYLKKKKKKTFHKKRKVKIERNRECRRALRGSNVPGYASLRKRKYATVAEEKCIQWQFGNQLSYEKRALIAFLCGRCVMEWRLVSSSAPSDAAVLPRREPLFDVSGRKSRYIYDICWAWQYSWSWVFRFVC